MITQAEIRRQLISYLRNALSLADFEDWLVSHSLNMHLDSDQEAIDLINDIEISLSEYSNSYLSISELRQRLSEALKNTVVFQSDDFPPTTPRTAASMRWAEAPRFAVPA